MGEKKSEQHESKSAANRNRLQEAEALLFQDEKELIREVILALRTMQYGSILLTVHDGQLVEVSKNIRIRKNRVPGRDSRP